MINVFKEMSWLHRTCIWIGIVLIILVFLGIGIRTSQVTSIELSPLNIFSNGSVIIVATGGEGLLSVKICGGTYEIYEYSIEDVDATRFILNISMEQPIAIEANTDIFSGTTIIAASFNHYVKDLFEQMDSKEKYLGLIELGQNKEWIYNKYVVLGKLLALYIEVHNRTNTNIEIAFHPIILGTAGPEATITLGVMLILIPLVHTLFTKRAVKR